MSFRKILRGIYVLIDDLLVENLHVSDPFESLLLDLRDNGIMHSR